MSDKHVMVLKAITVEKAGGAKTYYQPGLALVAPELAEAWLAAKMAEPWPKPVAPNVEETVTPVPEE
jgi:hypothetical protein